ncbi:MAG: hypothetical protein KF715_05020 [Candidatus Didemnitutus sp.]|nr:hypothetical protein [Candidatus Didemnitutus sp.]
MKITIELDGEAELAFRLALRRLRFGDRPGERSTLAFSFIRQASDAVVMAPADVQPTTWPSTVFELRGWTDEERAAFQAIAGAGRAFDS